MKIVIDTINHKDQRVGEVGDYWEKDGIATFVISIVSAPLTVKLILADAPDVYVIAKSYQVFKDGLVTE